MARYFISKELKGIINSDLHRPNRIAYKEHRLSRKSGEEPVMEQLRRGMASADV